MTMDAGTRTIPDSTFRFRAQPPPPTWHYLLLLGMVLLGLGLRFWQLDSKPLWLDEVITAVFALGRNYREISTNTFIGLETLTSQFALNSTTTCATIAQTLITDSSHPPLFFCGLHRWLVGLNPAPDQLAWALRSLPALLGTLLIPLIYALNRVAVSSAAGLVGAGFMAVSPFAVYLSQEARHYTLPMVLITLALLCGVWMLQDLLRDRVRAWAWLFWIAVSLCGLYTHYFFLIALVAQMLALVGVCLQQGQGLLNWRGLLLGLAIAILILGYFPWIPVLYQHFSQPATDWLSLAPGWGRLNPLYQGLAGWIIFFILLPVENQPLAIAIPLGVVMLAVFVGLVWQVWQGLRSFYNQHPTHPAVSFLLLSTLLIGLEFLVIIYGLGKDLTLAPRYSFVYFPGVCALVGIALAQRVQRRSRFPSSLSRRSLTSRNWRQLTTILVLALGLLSSMFVVHGLGFQKSYNPEIVADNVLRSPNEAMAIAFIYPTVQELALHLSFAYEIQQELVGRDAPSNVALAFLPQGATQTPAEVLLPELEGVPETLWIVTSPGYDTFPDTRNLSTSIGETATCQIEPEGRYQIFGVPYQRYTCQRS